MKIKDLGEFGLIEKIKKLTKVSNDVVGIGDDCAIIPFGNKELLVTTDGLVEGVHFFSDIDPYLLGRKAISVNLSDIAAMAGIPKWAFLSISLKSNTDVQWIDKLLDGFLDVLNEFRVELLGGDTTAAGQTVINITLIGINDLGSSIRRSGAKKGDLVAVSGEIGCSFVGLKALINNIKGYEDEKQKHLNPKPRISEALKIKPYANAMIDVSDGLVKDCMHICETSKVGMKLYLDSIPICKNDIITEKEALCGGEDYELVFCFSNEHKNIIENMEEFTIIGEVVEGEQIQLFKNGISLEVEDCGFRHF